MQEFLHEEPYTAEDIEIITEESLSSVFASSATSLDVLRVAKHFKLFQVTLNLTFHWYVCFRTNIIGVWTLACSQV